MKNLVITSESSQALYNSMNNGKNIGDSMDINFNLV